MKQLIRIAFFVACIAFVNSPASAFISPAPMVSEVSAADPKPSPFAGMSVQDFLTLTPKKYKELTGKKMTMSQKISLKISQYKVKKAVKNNKQVDLMKMTPGVDTADFSIGGLVLGLVLGIIGVLIAYLIGDRAVIKWAWIGFAIWVGIVLLVLIL